METKKREIKEQVVETSQMVLDKVFSGCFVGIPLEDNYNICAPFVGAIEKVSHENSLGWIIPMEDKVSNALDFIVYNSYLETAVLVPKNLEAKPIFTGSEYHFPDADIKVIGVTNNFKLEITRYEMLDNQ